jgi:6-phosphofructokinase 1
MKFMASKTAIKVLIEDDMVLLNHQAVSGWLSKGGTYLGTSDYQNL